MQLLDGERGKPFLAREVEGGVKQQKLPTRKGSRNHKAVDSDANFAVLRKQADLGLVAVRRGR